MQQHISGNPSDAKQCGRESLRENKCEEVRIYHWLFLGLCPVEITLAFHISGEIGPTREGQSGFTTGAESIQLLHIQLPLGRDM
jgi:hypothetical protein